MPNFQNPNQNFPPPNHYYPQNPPENYTMNYNPQFEPNAPPPNNYEPNAPPFNPNYN